MPDTTTGGDLKPVRKTRKVGFLERVGRVISGTRPAGEPVRDPEGLRALIRADRIARRMTWQAYAGFLDVHLSTLHKIATGVHQASEMTEAIIREAIDANPVRN